MTAPIFSIEKLNSSHPRNKFSVEADRFEYSQFLRKRALECIADGSNVTYVAISSQRIEGYITLSFGQYLQEKSKYNYNFSTLHIGKMARHKDAEKGIGPLLFAFAFNKALEIADQVGLFAVDLIADGKPEKQTDLVNYYRRYGFQLFPENDRHMFLKLETLRDAKASATRIDI